MKVLSLFAGIGGIDLGLEMLGWETVAFSEYDPGKNGKPPKRQYAAEVMAARYPEAISVGDVTTLKFARNRAGVPGVLRSLQREGDVRDVGFATLYKGDIDIIAGGFPCQDISFAGKGAGIEEGTRSGLWRHFAEAIAGIRPRGVLIENVAALAGRGLDRVLHDLASAGYDCEWDVIAAAGVGAPHLRERLFVIAWPQNGGVHGQWPTPPVFDCWLEEPVDVPRLVTGDVPDRTARLRCLGNAVVPQCASWVGHLLSERINYVGASVPAPDQWDARHARGPEKGESKLIGWAGDHCSAPDDTIAGAKLPRAGRMTNGWVYERTRSCPQAHAKKTGLKYMAATLRPRIEDHPELPHTSLVPTPAAGMHNDSEGADTWIDRKVAHASKSDNPTRASMPLAVYAQVKADPRLVPTPTVGDAVATRNASVIRDGSRGGDAAKANSGETLTDYVDPTNGGRLLPTPQAADGDRTTDYQQRNDGTNPTLKGAAKLLPTPTVSDGIGGPGAAASTQGSPNLRSDDRLLSTPRSCSGLRSSGMNRSEMMDALAQSPNDGGLLPTPRASEWKGVGPLGSKSHEYRLEKGYLDATVQDIEQRTGRLNPEWVTFLQGFPPGWTVIA